MQKMWNMISLGLIVFLSINPTLAITPSCCDEIKEELAKKSDAQKALCSSGNTLPRNCCKDIENEVEKYRAAYAVICPPAKHSGHTHSATSCHDPKALGMQSGKIPDNAINASSAQLPYYQPWFARLLNHAKNKCSWAPHKKYYPNSWLQIDLGQKAILTGIATQGSCRGSGYVKSYLISYSNDGQTWTVYQEGGAKKIISGNKDTKSVVKNNFQVPFEAKFVKIRPQTYYYAPTLRVELYGCRV